MSLIARRSITPNDNGCQFLMAERLLKLGFDIHHLRFGDVDNLWARRGTGRPLLVFAGHTDVVPTGPLEQWHSDPFTPTLRDGYLYGRGAADMKGSLAAMVVAVERFVEQHPDHPGSIGFLITSDEEGPAVNGTIKVIEWLKDQDIAIDWCLVGEPSSEQVLGDTIKNGRRGSLNASLTVKGLQGHVAYPHKSVNPIHRSLGALNELCTTHWDHGNEFFPPTSFQISNIHAGTGADNVIPGHLDLAFNFRYSTEQTADQLQQRVTAILDQHQLDYDCRWRPSGEPFLTKSGKLLDATCQALQDTLGVATTPATSGGTSDGRFIAPTGAEVVELGPVNATIHRINECVGVEELEGLTVAYMRILSLLLASQG